MKRANRVCWIFLAAALSASAQSNLLSNPGFETGYDGQRMMDAISAWPPETYPVWDWGRIRSAGTTATHSGTNTFQLDAYANYNKVMAQRWPAQTSRVYEVTGWLKSPAGAGYFQPTNGFCYVKIDFLNAAGAALGGQDSWARFGVSGPTNWTQFTTGPVLPPAGAVTGRALFGYCPGGDDWGPIGDQTTSGFVYFDDMQTFTNDTHGAGLLQNAGFEVRNCGYLPLTNFPFWEGFGPNGGVVTNHRKSGNLALQIWGLDNLAGQKWSAARSNQYATGAYIFSTNFTTTNAFGIVQLQFLDATGTNVLLTYESARFTAQSPSNAWTYYEASGWAPSGTVYGRTLVGIVGSSSGFGTSTAWFDDSTQRLVSTTGTVAGLLRNGGFDDGPTGNAYDLARAGDLPAWNWLGGTNGGFINRNFATNGLQSLSLTYPDNAVAQSFIPGTGLVYTLEGYMYNPAAEKFTGAAFGMLTLEFTCGTTVVSSVESAHFTSASPSNTWVRFAVTNRAPWFAAGVTGRVSCMIAGDPSGFGGALYFDAIRLSVTTSALADTQAGALWNPGFEFTANGTKLAFVDKWTALGADGLVSDTQHKSGNHGLRIYTPETMLAQLWPATQAWKYATAAYALTPSADPLQGTSSVHGVVLLQFMDATGTNILKTYESAWFTTANPADVWTNLEAQGVAPAGTKYGRTVVGLLGFDDEFGGSVWFDDATQRVVSATGTVAGVICNPGFEDGPPGNAYDLALAGDFPGWQWLGGTNAGYVTDAYKYEGNQSLAITYPANAAAQSFAAATGKSYIVEGYLFSPSAGKLTGNAYGVLVLEFFKGNFNNGTTVVSSVESLHFTSASAADTWIKFSVTNRAPWSGFGITGRLTCMIAGDPSGFGGAVYFDALRVTETNIAAANAQAGALWNPGFEYTARGTVLAQADNWTASADNGRVSDLWKHEGNLAVQLTAPNVTIGQSWPATQGWVYATAGWAFTPSADPIYGNEDLAGKVQLQYLDSTGTNVLATYDSAVTFGTGSAADTWIIQEASGVSPVGAKYGRTIYSFTGTPGGFSGSLWVDDFTQRVVSTTGTVAGVLHNPGFDDGIAGNAYDLDRATNLPYWSWLGGTNAGFITTSYKRDGLNSLGITWAGNMMAQSVAAVTGATYVFDGYLYNPAAEKFTGSAYGVLILEFYRGTTLVSSVASAHFTAASPSNAWVKFAVTNRAPWSGFGVTSRVLCAIMGSDSGYGGALYFDQHSLNYAQVPATNPAAGALYNYGFEYTAAGTQLAFLDNWSAFGEAGLIGTTYKHSGENALQLYYPGTLAYQDWSATPGNKYRSAGWLMTPTADRLAGTSNLYGAVILQFLDATGTNILQSYLSPAFTTNCAADVWTNLAAVGVAPKGTVYGRTLVALLGTNTGFSGSLWFDDMTQSVVSATGTVSGLLRNAGFDDGPSGNTWNLDATNDLPHWFWIGGTNAGFITQNYRKNGEQSLVLTYPQNSLAQEWTATGGCSYVASGYLFTPAEAKFNSDGSSYGQLRMTFYTNGGTVAVSSATAGSPGFGADQPANTWVYFAVTGTAPNAAVVTGRLTCTIHSDDPGADMDLAGVIHFDQLYMTNLPPPDTTTLELAAGARPEPVRVGGFLTNSIVVTNRGMDWAANTTVADVLPENMTFVTNLPSQGAWEISDGVIYNYLGRLDAGAAATIRIVVIPTAAGVYTNNVSVYADNADGGRAAAVSTVLSGNRGPEITVPGPHVLPVGAATNFAVSVYDPDHDPYLTLSNTVYPAGATFVASNFNWTAVPSFCNTTNWVLFVADDHTGETNSIVTNGTYIVVPYDFNTNGIDDGWEFTQFHSLTNRGAGDHDGDGCSDNNEYIAGTQPTNASSFLSVREIRTPAGSSNHYVKVATEPNRKYTIYYANGGMSNNSPWAPFANTNWGVWIETGAVSTNHEFLDNEGANSSAGAPPAAGRRYKVKVTYPPTY